MITSLMVTTVIWLILISLIDLKYKTVPSIITWSFVLFNLILAGPVGVFGGLVMLVLGLFLMDYSDNINFFEGGADLKALVAIGFTLYSQLLILAFIPILLACGLIYKLAMKQGLNVQNNYEVAFIPVLLISYSILCFGVNLWF